MYVVTRRKKLILASYRILRLTRRGGEKALPGPILSIFSKRIGKGGE